MTIIGIDPGVTGAIAILSNDGEFLAVHDMPSLPDGAKGRNAVNAPLLSSIISDASPSVVYCEYVGARPGEGAVGAFAFGRSRGVIEGVCGALGIPVVMITPPVWKRVAGIAAGSDKEASRARAIARWPRRSDLFARKKDAGRAEAALIAVAGIAREAA